LFRGQLRPVESIVYRHGPRLLHHIVLA